MYVPKKYSCFDYLRLFGKLGRLEELCVSNGTFNEKVELLTFLKVRGIRKGVRTNVSMKSKNLRDIDLDRAIRAVTREARKYLEKYKKLFEEEPAKNRVLYEQLEFNFSSSEQKFESDRMSKEERIAYFLRGS